MPTAISSTTRASHAPAMTVASTSTAVSSRMSPASRTRRRAAWTLSSSTWPLIRKTPTRITATCFSSNTRPSSRVNPRRSGARNPRWRGPLVIGTLSDWLDHRIGYRRFMHLMLIEHIPGGARWRYVWGSCLLFVFGLQMLTGVLLMTAYAPSDSTAWASVYYIQYEMDFGWLIRGLHHF